jgi:uncharacterized protein (TIGR00255 family)
VIRSMTGYGESTAQVDDIHYSIELRSVNNRYFKATIRLPDILDDLEADLEALLRKQINRGTLTLSVKIRSGAGGQPAEVNDAALLEYVRHLEAIQETLGEHGKNVNIDLTALLAMPGVLRSPDRAEFLAKTRPVIEKLTVDVAKKVLAMRQIEGQSLLADLVKNRDVIIDRLAIVRVRAPKVVEEYQGRIKTRVNELLARTDVRVDDKDLIREVAIFAERVDVAEEIARLTGHMEQFDKLTSTQYAEPAGRTLDFLAQEMLREANTIASKCNDVLIAQAVVEIKGAIDRIKEQVQNAE